MQSVDPKEIEHFSRLAHEWWDARGAFAPLHAIAPLRVGYIAEHAGPLAGKTVLDIGCGGGLIAEAMARAGANVSALDASETNIAVARAHAAESGLFIDYRATTAEALLATGAQFDVVLSLEVLEHVEHPDAFLHACMGLLRPGGRAVFSTINRTWKAYALAIIGAEYVLRWVPKGTHHYDKFIRPAELARWVRGAGGHVLNQTGLVLNPVGMEWSLSDDISVNYMVAVEKA